MYMDLQFLGKWLQLAVYEYNQLIHVCVTVSVKDNSLLSLEFQEYNFEH